MFIFVKSSDITNAYRREVSPTYGSPDGLVRRPLRSPPDNMVEEKMAVTEDLSTDEEITFNFLQRKAAGRKKIFSFSVNYKYFKTGKYINSSGS